MPITVPSTAPRCTVVSLQLLFARLSPAACAGLVAGFAARQNCAGQPISARRNGRKSWQKFDHKVDRPPPGGRCGGGTPTFPCIDWRLLLQLNAPVVFSIAYN